MKLHFNPGTLLNKTHCGSELAPLSKDTHALTRLRTQTHREAHAHVPHKCIPAFMSHTHMHTVSAPCSPKVIKPNEALQGHAAFSVFFEMMRGFVPQPQWNKRVESGGQNL